MPQETRLSQMKSYFFANPKKVSVGVGASFGVATLIGLLFPTSFKLAPLGNTKKDAKGDRDDAQDKYDNTLQQFNTANAAIVEARQRVIDLDCAMAGYQQFNNRLIPFLQSLGDPQKTTTDRLALWQIYFTPDKTVNDQSSIKKTYTQDEWVYETYESCDKGYCDKNVRCCYVTGNHWVTFAYDYYEVTRIANIYKNIIQGTKLNFPSLNCGYYSRTFETFIPETYQTYQSNKVNSGDRSTGYTYVDFRREYGSRVSARRTLDGNSIDTQITVLREATQSDAAADLAQNLYTFFVQAIAVFNATGINYPALQQGIRNSIPLLIESAAAINVTLQEDARVLADKEEIYSVANDEFKEGATLWLNLFFLTPIGVTLVISLLTYLIATGCKDCCTRQQEEAPEIDPKDIELATPALQPSPQAPKKMTHQHFMMMSKTLPLDLSFSISDTPKRAQ